MPTHAWPHVTWAERNLPAALPLPGLGGVGRGSLALAVSQPSAPHPTIAVRTLLSRPLDAPPCSLCSGHKEQTISCDGHTEPRAPRNLIAARLAHGGWHSAPPHPTVPRPARGQAGPSSSPEALPWARHILCGNQAGDPRGRGVRGNAEDISGVTGPRAGASLEVGQTCPCWPPRPEPWRPRAWVYLHVLPHLENLSLFHGSLGWAVGLSSFHCLIFQVTIWQMTTNTHNFLG